MSRETLQQGYHVGSGVQWGSCGERGNVQDARTSLFISHTLDRRWSR